MSELVSRLRARLAEKRNGNYKEYALGYTGKDNCADDTNCRNSIGTTLELLGTSRDYEGARADLRTACILYVRARRYLYPGYMEKAFLVFGVLIDEEVAAQWFGSYCLEPYPDVCYCGVEFVSNHGSIRSHCSVCRGQAVGLGYDMQRLSQELGIHYSWIEYGFAWALSKVGGVKI